MSATPPTVAVSCARRLATVRISEKCPWFVCSTLVATTTVQPVQARVTVYLPALPVQTLDQQEGCSSVERGSSDPWSRDRRLLRSVRLCLALVPGWTRLLVSLFRALMHLFKRPVNLFPDDDKNQGLIMDTVLACGDPIDLILSHSTAQSPNNKALLIKIQDMCT